MFEVVVESFVNFIALLYFIHGKFEDIKKINTLCVDKDKTRI